MDLNEDGLQSTADSLRSINKEVDVLILPTNVSEESEVISTVAKAQSHFGRIDYVVQSAGLNQRPRALLHETEMANFDRVVNVNMRGLYVMQREIVRAARTQDAPVHGQRCSIVNIASISGIQPTPNLVPVSADVLSEYLLKSSLGLMPLQYAASKAGVIALTKGDAQAYIAEGIRVSAQELPCSTPSSDSDMSTRSTAFAQELFSHP